MINQYRNLPLTVVKPRIKVFFASTVAIAWIYPIDNPLLIKFVSTAPKAACQWASINPGIK
eukprot:Awhi_evm1s4516